MLADDDQAASVQMYLQQHYVPQKVAANRVHLAAYRKETILLRGTGSACEEVVERTSLATHTAKNKWLKEVGWRPALARWARR